MITQKFKSGGGVVFADNGSICLPDVMTAEEFAEFMPLAMHVYHQRDMAQQLSGANAPCHGPGGKLVNGKIPRKRGRPATKTTTAKRGRPRKANKE